MSAQVQLKLTPFQFDLLREALDLAIRGWEVQINNILDEARNEGATGQRAAEAAMGEINNKLLVATSLRTQFSSGG